MLVFKQCALLYSFSSIIKLDLDTSSCVWSALEESCLRSRIIPNTIIARTEQRFSICQSSPPTKDLQLFAEPVSQTTPGIQ